MYLSKFQLLNYKSFRDSGVLEFKPGINIIIGTNNSGKTAFVEGLSLNFQNHIHKSLKTFPSRSDVINSYSGYQISLNVEITKMLMFLHDIYRLGDKTIIIPISDKYIKNGSPSQEINEIYNKEFFNNYALQNKEVEIQIRSISSYIIPFDIPCLLYSSYSTPLKNLLTKNLDIPNLLNKKYSGFCGISNIAEGGKFTSGELPQTIQYKIFEKYRQTIYKFNAERLNIGISQIGTSRELKSDASNLAEVLSNLQGNPSLFTRFNEYVSTVIPGIKKVSVLPYNNTSVEIKIWTLDPTTEREDLAHPLSHCGTGVSQVLAILYVVVTSQEPRIIIIDELQSFLHPGATRKLIEILKKFPEHQYFIATHSAEIIAAANPSTIVKLSYEKSETRALTISARDIKEQRLLLAELGVSLSDVFGADNILWVEGPTEEKCFSLILEKVDPQLLTVTKIISVNNTGDLLRKTKVHLAHVMFDLYNRISGGKSLYPPAVGFVFDKERLSDTDIKDLQRRTPHSLKFIERRMYENYLLHPEAIAFVLNQEIELHQKIEEQKQFLTSEEVLKWLESNKKDYFSPAPTEENLSNPQWVNKNIDGAKLLAALFANFPQAKVEFSKTTHSVKLTEWLLENNPACFDELVQFLQGVIAEGKAMMFSCE